MWWYFRKNDENEEYIEYLYARESRDTDGIVRYYKKNHEAECIRACTKDMDSEFSANVAAEKLYYLEDDGFPDECQIACG